MSGRSGSRREERPADVARRLKDSLVSTENGLKSFVQSLERSGLRGAAPAYRQMALAVAQQKLWADQHDRRELDRHFRGIARNADDIHKLMTRFADAIAPLADLANLKAAVEEAPPPAPEPTAANDAGPPAPSALARKALATLMSGGRMSERRLAASLDIERDALIPLLAELAEAGLIERRGWGRSKSAAVSPAWTATLLSLEDS